MKSSTVETSLFLWPPASAPEEEEQEEAQEEALWYEGLAAAWPVVREIPALGRDALSSWAWGGGGEP